MKETQVVSFESRAFVARYQCIYFPHP